MIFTESWLRELINFPVSTAELAEQLTMAGLEVESVSQYTAGFSGVIVSRVLAVEPLAGSDKLTLCKVDTGTSGSVTIVCGAPNVRAGICYPLARPGATLPGDIIIKSMTKHGVVSDGMLCSEKELGLSEYGDGLFELPTDTVPGTALDDYLGLQDVQIEVSLTPNRGDCLGMSGLAREVAVLNNLTYSPPSVLPVTRVINDTRNVSLAAGTACPRYCGRIIHQIDMSRPMPVHISERLRRSGIRAINPVVDLANYVMLETGQPMHVFDNDALNGQITARFAAKNEKIVLLDGETRTLSENTLVIADHNGAVAMAGIMGGLHSAVKTGTRSIFIESAYFDPRAIMGRARQYGLHTDASHRYERGVDPELPPLAIERLTALILEVCGGNPGPVQQTVNPADLPSVRSVRLRLSRVRRLLGIDISQQRISAILSRLGFQLETCHEDETMWNVRIPSYRFDISIEADLIEEIARIQGYQNIEGSAPVIRMHIQPPDLYKTALHRITAVLSARGYHEVINYSFVDPSLQTLLSSERQAITLLNPISAEMKDMRLGLWSGLIQSLLYNVKRQQPMVRLFETGKLYRDIKRREEVRVVGGLIYGNKYKKQWDIENSLCDFYDIKSDLEALILAQDGKLSLSFKQLNHVGLHPGQSAAISVNGIAAGVIGMLHPDLQRRFSLPSPAFLFELEIDKITRSNNIKFNKISKYPSVKRDISIVVDEQVFASDILDTIKKASNEPLINLELFDVYRGEGIDSGKKSLALGLTFQRSSSTLTDEEADVAISNVLQSLLSRFGALLRE